MPGPSEGFTIFGEVIPTSGDIAASDIREFSEKYNKDQKFLEARLQRLEAMVKLEPLQRPLKPKLPFAAQSELNFMLDFLRRTGHIDNAIADAMKEVLDADALA